MSRPTSLRSPAELFADYEHGTRYKYLGGCRCDACREANTEHERQRRRARRKGDWNGLIDSAPVREHLIMLSRAGIGLREVANITGAARSILADIKQGRRLKMRALSARAVLRVDISARNKATLLPAVETWARLRELMALGMTKTEIARRLGSKAKVPALQVQRLFVTAKNALAVERLHREVIASTRITHEVREELRELSTRAAEVDAVLLERAERARESKNEYMRSYMRGYNKRKREERKSA